MYGLHGGGGERCLSLAYKICKKNKEDWTSVEKGLIFSKVSILNQNK